MACSGFNYFLIASVLLFSIISAAPASSEESKDSDETTSTFGDILRSVGSSIQRGVKKVEESVQKGYDYVKSKVSAIGEDDSSESTSSNNSTSTSTTTTTIIATKASEIDQLKPTLAADAKTTLDIDDRFLFDSPLKCPDGQLPDHANKCRTG